MTIKEKLAIKIEALYSNEIIVYPEDLKVNKGPRWASDTACWQGIGYHKELHNRNNSAGIKQFFSYETMTQLATQKQPLVFIGNDNFVKEIS